MKNIRIVSLAFVFLLFAGCTSLPKDDEQTWIYSSDKLTGVLVQRDGLHFSKKNLSGYKNVVFNVEKILSEKDNQVKTDPYLMDMVASSSKSEDIYPFVEKNHSYKVWVSYKSSKSGKIIHSKSVTVTATGGLGEARMFAAVNKKSYDSKNWAINFSGLEKKIPVKIEKENISGDIYLRGAKKSFYFNDFRIEKNKMSLKPVMGQIRDEDFSLDLVYSFDYEGKKYTQNFINDTSCFFTDNNAEVKIQNTGLPAVYITTKSKKPVASREKYEDAVMKIGSREYNLKIKGRGNSSWGQFPKHSYTLKLNKSEKILDFTKNKNWVLVSNYGDKTLIRNQYVYYLGKDVFNSMMWNPSFRQVDLFINNEYAGTYLLGEKIGIGKNRVNVAQDGFIVEMNRREDEDFNFRTTRDVSISLKEPETKDKKRRAEIQKIVQKAEDAMFSKNFTDPQKGYAAYIDVDSFIDWYLINEFAKNVDSAWFSSIYIVFDPKDGKLHLGPLWDYDLGLGNINYNDCDNPEGFYIQKRSIWFAQLFKDPEFRRKVKNRWMQKRGLLEKSIDKQITLLSNQVMESSYYNFERWPVLGDYVWPNADGWENRLSINSEIEYLQNWCKARFKWMDQVISKW